jgi:hypothetical protein
LRRLLKVPPQIRDTVENGAGLVLRHAPAARVAGNIDRRSDKGAAMKRENEFYLLDTRSYLGSTCMFWAIDGQGYTSNLDKAHVFNHEDAQKWADRRTHFTPLSKKSVDALATLRIDCQLIKPCHDFGSGVIIHRCQSAYDGNDICLDAGEEYNTTFNFEKAEAYTLESAAIRLNSVFGKILSRSFLLSIARRTFQKNNIDKRRMMGAAGIKYRSPRKKRETTGKSRGKLPCLRENIVGTKSARKRIV